MGMRFNSKRGSVPSHSLKEAINLFVRTGHMPRREIGLMLGHSESYIASLTGHDTIHVATELKMFHFIYKNWPAHYAMPALVRDFAQREFPNDLGRAPRPVQPDKVERPCISCTRIFESEGAHNRMCPQCRARASGLGKDFT